MTHADLVARLIDVTDRLEHMIKFRHDEAHNGDVYKGGPYSSCGMCAGTREAIDAARDALAALPPPADEVPQPPYCVRHGVMQANDEMGRSWSCGCQTAKPYDGDGYIYTPAAPPALVALRSSLLTGLEAIRQFASPHAAHAQGWQPIETAPEGVDVLAFFPGANEECQRMIVHRLDGDWYPQDASIGEPIDDVTPTHWMEMPSGPKL